MQLGLNQYLRILLNTVKIGQLYLKALIAANLTILFKVLRLFIIDADDKT